MIDKFFKQVIKTSECWLWTGNKDNDGYGKFSIRIDGKRFYFRAHRFIYEFVCGIFDANLFVCHRCDNPTCVNPDHLFLGTAKDNNNDATRKGRYKAPSGDRHWSKQRPQVRDESGKFKKAH